MPNAIAVLRRSSLVAGGFCLLAASCLAAEPAAKTSHKRAKPEAEAPAVSLFDAVKAGDLVVDAEGTGDGRMTLSLTNQSRKPLKVVLPPGLIASGANGQMMGGGMGGMGGGMDY